MRGVQYGLIVVLQVVVLFAGLAWAARSSADVEPGPTVSTSPGVVPAPVPDTVPGWQRVLDGLRP